MSEQTSPLEILQEALASARMGDWRQVQDLCSGLGDHPPPVVAVARLNILICHYLMSLKLLLGVCCLAFSTVVPSAQTIYKHNTP